jgi:MraZ protein
LASNAIIAGVGEYFEIWSPEGWVKQETILQDPDATAQRYAALDLSV